MEVSIKKTNSGQRICIDCTDKEFDNLKDDISDRFGDSFEEMLDRIDRA